ncbi:extracellular solute-binding protein [Lactobacillus sp. DCY120]|uniref:Extracellular solute-binding protein n=2 Tax=Bombilactobacillus apium TaxID=2675299 RepID=A0A850R1G9_9LACO|nr:extracellular solute-binding protein [Bombilactobacillus apium]
MARDVTQPFARQHQAQVHVQSGASSARYTQIEHNSRSGIDVIELSQNNALTGNQKQLFQKLDFKKIKNFSTLTPTQQKLARQTNSLPYTVNSLGIIYNPKKLGQITSWDQLWSKKLQNKLAIPDITTTFGPAMVYLAGDHAQIPVTQDQGAAAFQALRQLRPNIVKTYSQASDLANMFKSGEIEAAVVGDFAVGIIEKAAPQTTYLVPQQGTYANYNTLAIVRHSKQQKLAYQYLNQRLSKSVQKKVAAPTSLNNAPVNQQVQLQGAAAKNKTYGDVAQRARMLDFTYINRHLASWVKQWNRILNQ